MSSKTIEIYGAREHNLQDISLSIPAKKLIVITGLSGSGKSSLAFDTIYAEGNRRYMDTMSAYARHFLGNLERPDVEHISGLSPVIAIEQKTTNKNPRSTVGTVTEIYDFLRLLFARASDAYSYVTGEKMVKYTDEKIFNLIIEKFKNKKIIILAPVVKGRKGHYRELFEQIRKKGFVKARVNGEIINIDAGLQLDRYKTHDIEIVVDRMQSIEHDERRLLESIKTALQQGKGIMMLMDADTKESFYFSRNLMCPTSGIAYDDPAPNLFSFNSPYGSCPKCGGLGFTYLIDEAKVIPDKKLSINKGGIAPLGKYKNEVWIFNEIEKIGKKYNFTLNTPIKDISEEALNAILYGINGFLNYVDKNIGITVNHPINFEGVVNLLSGQLNGMGHNWAKNYIDKATCEECNGTRLKKQSLYFKIDDHNIAQLSNMSISELNNWLKDIESRLSDKQKRIARDILKEIRKSVTLLLELGLGYLTLNRPSKTLSGGEAQRIRLATQIGSQLVNVLYILDEPSIGLHQRDNVRLINSLKQLRDINNSVIVVEHDKEMIMSADHIIDLGPGAGIHGGKVVAEGNIETILQQDTLTTQYLNGIKNIDIPSKRRKGNGKFLNLIGAKGNNLKNITVSFPLGKMICITGVSGSGKTSLVNATLHPILSKHFYNSLKRPLEYDSIEGIDNIDKVIVIDQSPIGRTPRSNPATYTEVFSDIRNLYVSLPESKIRGYKPGRFSFNVKGGRCETCMGAGLRTIEMNFLPDVLVKCETCNGRRYNRETLEVKYKGKSISDVLDMNIDQAVDFFENIPSITKKIQTLQQVGLGYINLGQASTTLSGGEAQRVKLATELSKNDTGNTLYILDEPTTGLHFEDIRILLNVLNKLINKGNTIIVIEHNMDVIKTADYIFDLGLEGGEEGGYIISQGTPEEIIKHKTSYTAKFLAKELIPQESILQEA